MNRDQNQEFEKFTSERGKQMMVYDNYIYHRDGVSDLGNRWRCKTRSCKGKSFEKHGSVVKLVEHSHDRQYEDVQVLRLKDELHNAAVKTTESPIAIVAQQLAAMPVEGCRVPRVKSLRDSITRQRKVLNILPSDIYEDIPTFYKKTLKGKPFLLFDNGAGNSNRIVIFADSDSLKLLDNACTLVADGTFYSAPKPFYQVYTIGVHLFGKFYPVVYGLLSNKRQNTYTTFLLEIAKHIDASKNRRILIDFERPMINALQTVFPSSVVSYCYFHLCQAVWRKIQTGPFCTEFKSNYELRITLRMLLAIAFVPPSCVKEEFEKLKVYCNAEEFLRIRMDDVLAYFDSTYVGLTREPLFEVKLWNVYEETLMNAPRTTNSIEGWHRGLKEKVRVAHPNLIMFIKVLQN